MAPDLSFCKDEELIERIRGGDALAEETLYSRYKKIVRSCARKYFMEGADREDLLQEGMIGLYRAVCSFDASREARFQSFAEVCIRRQIYSAIKGSLRKKHLILSRSISLDGETHEDGSESSLLGVIRTRETADPEEIFLEAEGDKALMERVRSALSPLERKCLTLYVQGESYDMIGEKLGKNRKSVDNAIQRIRKKLTPLFEAGSEA